RACLPRWSNTTTKNTVFARSIPVVVDWFMVSSCLFSFLNRCLASISSGASRRRRGRGRRPSHRAPARPRTARVSRTCATPECWSARQRLSSSGCPSSALRILDRIAIPHRRPRLGGHLPLVIPLLLQQRPRHGRVDGDVVLADEDLIVTDDPQPELSPFLILDLHPGTEEHPALLLRPVIHHLQVFQTLA